MLNIRDSVYQYLPHVVSALPKPTLNLLITILRKVFHESLFLDIYQKNRHLQGIDFVDSLLKELDIAYTVNANGRDNIPATGRVIIIANHLTGAQETMALVKTVSEAREDKKVKILANTMPMGIQQMRDLLIPVDNIKGARE